LGCPIVPVYFSEGDLFLLTFKQDHSGTAI
jgi:hypothetical protein